MQKILTTLFLYLFVNLSLFSQNLDIDILRDINLNRNQNLDNTFKFLSNSTDFVAVAVPVGIFTTGYFLDNKDVMENSLVGAAGVLSAGALTLIGKNLINRQRPYEVYILDSFDAGEGKSMPSGHTSIAFSTAMSITLQFNKWYVAIPSFIWASSVAYSRLHLGVHYPSDVLVGAVVGVASSYLSFYLKNYFRNK